RSLINTDFVVNGTVPNSAVAVARPHKSVAIRHAAADWARNKIFEDNGSLDYPESQMVEGFLTGCCDNPNGTDFYCSGFVYAAYDSTGDKLFRNFGWVTVDEVVFSGTRMQTV